MTARREKVKDADVTGLEYFDQLARYSSACTRMLASAISACAFNVTLLGKSILITRRVVQFDRFHFT